MPQESAVATLSELCVDSLGVFRGRDAVAAGVSRKRLGSLRVQGVIDRTLPDTYRMTAFPRSNEQALRSALSWAGDDAAAAGTSAGEVYGLEGVRAGIPEIVVPRSIRAKSASVVIHPEAFEIACEDARRRRLTSVRALRAYLDRFARPGRSGVRVVRQLLLELDPVHAARSTLEVKTRRLLVAHGITNFVRELPLEWNGRRYLFDFAFVQQRVILETNGRRWHDDPTDYEHDNEKWSVPGRHGYRIVFATWNKVTREPEHLLCELAAAVSRAW